MKTIDRICNTDLTTQQPKKVELSLRDILQPKPLTPEQHIVLKEMAKTVSSYDDFGKYNRKLGRPCFRELISYDITLKQGVTELHRQVYTAIMAAAGAILFRDYDNDLTVVGFEEINEEVFVSMYVVVKAQGTDLQIILSGSFEAATALKDTLETIKAEHNYGTVFKTITGITESMFSPSRFDVNTTIHQIDDLVLGEDAFYPFLKGTSVFDFGVEFAKSSAKAALLYGPPGNGKSTFARTLGVVMGYKNIYVCSDERVFTDKRFSKLINEVPDNTIFFLEDAYQFLKKRTDGNMNMSSLLALADGVAARNIKFVISTNLTKTTDVEQALLREGRCFGAYEFANLTFNHANTARESVGLEPMPRSLGNREFSLAAALNYKAGADETANEQSNVVDLPVTQSAK